MPPYWHWLLKWHNPYTQPPDGMPVIFGEYITFSPLFPHEFYRACPRGYSIYCDTVLPQRTTGWSEERKQRSRRRNVERRITTKYPLFAEEFITEEMHRKPEYYGLETGIDDG